MVGHTSFSVLPFSGKSKDKGCINGKSIAGLWSITCRMGSHIVTCHPTQINAARQAGTQFTYTRGIEG